MPELGNDIEEGTLPEIVDIGETVADFAPFITNADFQAVAHVAIGAACRDFRGSEAVFGTKGQLG